MSATEHHDPGEPVADPEEHATGTFTLLMLFVLAIMAVWFWVYYLLIVRS